MAGARRKARTLAFQALYEIDATRHKPEEAVSYLLADARISEDNIKFAQELVNGVVKNKEKIDENIQRFAPAWPIEQISMVDKNILRLAIFEILIDNKVPLKVAINEAVELAKAFGSDNSARFVNGVLGAVSSLASNKKS